MKITSDIAPVDFRPVTCTLEFTSNTEFQIFRHILSLNQRVPEMVESQSGYSHREVERIMDMIRTNLTEIDKQL